MSASAEWNLALAASIWLSTSWSRSGLGCAASENAAARTEAVTASWTTRRSFRSGSDKAGALLSTLSLHDINATRLSFEQIRREEKKVNQIMKKCWSGSWPFNQISSSISICHSGIHIENIFLRLATQL